MAKLANLQEFGLVINIIQWDIFKYLGDCFSNKKKSNVFNLVP